MNGAFIYPNGKILTLENSMSHSSILENKKIRDDVIFEISRNGSVKTMLDSGKIDIVNALMMVGFIRIMVFNCHMALEYSSTINNLQKHSICDLISSIKVEDIVVEDFITEKYLKFDNKCDFLEFIDNM